jgi:hypothetical protein
MQPQATSELNVLSPWADADPVPLSGISERLESLQDKTIGLFCNSKRAARPVLKAVETYISEHYPNTKTSLYVYSIPNVPEMESPNKDKFSQWLDTVDGVILAVGD